MHERRTFRCQLNVLMFIITHSQLACLSGSNCRRIGLTASSVHRTETNHTLLNMTDRWRHSIIGSYINQTNAAKDEACEADSKGNFDSGLNTAGYYSQTQCEGFLANKGLVHKMTHETESLNKWLHASYKRYIGKYIGLCGGSSAREKIRPWAPSSLAIDFASSNEEINVR